jgi:FAD/FMN-containing dehydrogenase
MARKHGLAIDNLVSAEVVLANGEIVNASETENSDLFWAIRGGGGNFGIVTEFTFKLASVPQILGGIIAIPATPETVRAYLDYSVSAPDDLTTIANVIYAPPLPFVPAEHVGKLIIAILVTWTGSIEDGEKALAPLREMAEPIVDLVSPMPYPAIYNLTAQQADPHGASIRSMFTNELSDDSIAAIFDAMANPSSPMAIVQLRGMGGAVSRVAPEATAFAHRTQPYFVAIINLWSDPQGDAAPHRAWTETLWKGIRADADGVYVNFLEDEGRDRVRDAYPAATYGRLAEIKRQYDPTNLFRFNQNIAPKR